MMIGAKQCTLPQTKNRDNGSIYALLIDTKPASMKDKPLLLQTNGSLRRNKKPTEPDRDLLEHDKKDIELGKTC